MYTFNRYRPIQHHKPESERSFYLSMCSGIGSLAWSTSSSVFTQLVQSYQNGEPHVGVECDYLSHFHYFIRFNFYLVSSSVSMFTTIALRTVLKSSAGVLRESGSLCSAVSLPPWTCSAALLSGPRVSCGKYNKKKNI